MIRVLNAMLRIQKDKQVDIGKTSLLELNSMDMSYSSAKEAIINEFEKCFLLLLKDCDTISGQSVAVWPGKRLWMISGHLELAVIVRKRSGLWKCL